SKLDAAAADTAAYNSDSVGGGVFFGIPLSEDHTLNLGADVERIDLETTSTSAQVAQDFVATHGSNNRMYKTTFGWAYDTLDNPNMPSSGALQRIGGEIAVPGSDVEYYKVTYSAGRYWALSDTVSFRMKGELG